MPRPSRDYNVTIRQDIERLDRRIQALATERAKKVRMLEVFNSDMDVDVSAVLTAVASKSRAAKKARR